MPDTGTLIIASATLWDPPMNEDRRVVVGLIVLAVVCAIVLFVFAQTAGGTVLM
jgi:hypothetical protein